jgi:hypothetical protein
MMRTVTRSRRGKTIKMDALLATGEEQMGDAARVLRWGGLSMRAKQAWVLTIRDGPFCGYCGVELDDSNRTIDHVQPKARGGSLKLKNLRLCCNACNQLKGTLSVAEFEATRAPLAGSSLLPREPLPR